MQRFKFFNLCHPLLYKADRGWGRRVAEELKLDVKQVEKLAAISQDERAAAT